MCGPPMTGASGLDRMTAWLPAVLGAVLGAALVLSRELTYGVSLHYDPVNYIAAARSLLAGEGFANYTGGPYVKCPLYPLLLAAASLGAFDPLDVAGPLNAALFGLTVAVVGRYLRRRLGSRFLAAWACLVVALSPLAFRAMSAFADTAFILLAILALIRTDEFLAEGRTSSLAWAAVCSALAWQTQYVGVAVPVAVGLALLVQPDTPPRQRARRAAVVALTAATPMGLWLARNLLVAGSLTGSRLPIDYDAAAAVPGAFGRLWGSWLHFDLVLLRWWEIGVPAQACLVAAVLIPVGFIFVREHRTPWRTSALPHWRPFYLSGGFSVIYLGLFTTFLMLGAIHPGALLRHLDTLYLPLLIALLVGLDRLLGHERERRRPESLRSPPPERRAGTGGGPSLPAALLMLALSLWTAGQVGPAIDRVRRGPPQCLGQDFCTRHRIGYETLRYVREHPVAGDVYSNLSYLVYLHAGGAGMHTELPGSRPGSKELAAWLAGAPDGATVIWIDDSRKNRIYDYDAADMCATPGLRPVAMLADGAVFRVHKAEALRARYPSVYESVATGDAGPPTVPAAPAGEDRRGAHAAFDLYSLGTTLAYRKEPCAAEDVQARFFLHLFPANTDDLPAHRQPYGFDSRDFDFRQHGVVADGVCLAMITLPDREIRRIRTGQWIGGEDEVWRAEIERP